MAVDTVTYEILRHRLWMINEEMAKVIKRISGSPIVYDTNDFSTGLFDADGNQVFVSCYMTNLAASLQDCVKYIAKNFKGHIDEGDLFYTNDPWVGVVHYNDYASIAPIFWKGDIIAFTGIVMHEVDVGGPRTLANTKATDAYSEAPLFPPVKLIEQGNLREDLERVFLKNSRTAGLVGLDMRARIAAHNLAQQAVLEVVSQYGKDTFEEVLHRVIAFTKESIKDKLRRLPDGTWREENYLDHDGFENRLYKVALTMTKEGDKLCFDFRGCAKQAPGPINLSPPGLKGAVILGILPLICYDSAWSTAAVFETVEIKAEEGSILCAPHPAPIGIATISAQMIAGSLVRSCIAKMYCCSDNYKQEVQSGGTTSSQVHTISGRMQGKPVISLSVPAAMGYGARSWKDGIDSAGPPGNPRRATTGIEVIERYTPILMLYYKQDYDTVGYGKYRGGMGTHWAWIIHKNEGQFTEAHYSSGANHPPVKALYGGYVSNATTYIVLHDSDVLQLLSAGAIPSDYTEISGKEIEVLEAKGEISLNKTDVLVGFTTGGGGYGDPLERSPELVIKEVSQGWCSPDVAKRIYGVVLRGDGSVDLQATAEQRALLRRRRIDNGKPVNAEIFRRNSQIEAKGSSLLTIADCLKVIQGDDQRFIVCARCGYGFSSLDENYKLGAWLYEIPVEELSRLNRWARMEHGVVIKNFCCPKCGLSVGCEVAKREDPPLFDTLVKLGQVSG